MKKLYRITLRNTNDRFAQVYLNIIAPNLTTAMSKAEQVLKRARKIGELDGCRVGGTYSLEEIKVDKIHA